MAEGVQSAVNKLWSEISSDNLDTHADLDGYHNDFYKLFGFNADSIDYDLDVDIERTIKDV